MRSPTTADQIYDQTQVAMQDADEIWGMADDIEGYIALMERIKRSVQDRIDTARASLSATRTNCG